MTSPRECVHPQIAFLSIAEIVQKKGRQSRGRTQHQRIENFSLNQYTLNVIWKKGRVGASITDQIVVSSMALYSSAEFTKHTNLDIRFQPILNM